MAIIGADAHLRENDDTPSPLVAKEGGVLVRGGHTESGVDLCKLALPDEALNPSPTLTLALSCGRGWQEPVALIAELANDDGTMMRLPDCDRFAKQHGFPLITVEALEKYLRKKQEKDGVAWR